MKRSISILLALLVLLASMSIMALADQEIPVTSETQEGSTPLEATIGTGDFDYIMVIPSKTTVTHSGVTPVGLATVKDVRHADATTVITYTAEGSDFVKSDDESQVMKATYTSDAEGAVAFTSDPVTVFEDNSIVDSANLPSIYVNILEADWMAAPTGLYTASITFNYVSTFTAGE